MTFQKYPVGFQDFDKIISEDFVYVDKTRLIHKLAERGGYYFLSRPRRFGKSLLISTMECLFQGKAELFKGLYIADKWDFEPYPVIRISFANIGYREIPLNQAIALQLQAIAQSYGHTLESTAISLMFYELIKKLAKQFGKGVVVLIDEYDKPLIDYLDKEHLHKALENRAVLKTFYSILKDADPHLKLVFITGITKFSQVSIFSDLNNLFDISLDLTYNDLCGISQSELERDFPQELALYNKQQMKEWYNGYRWDVRGETVYNPFSVLNFFSRRGDFENYWYATGTPTFLVKMCLDQSLFDLEGIEISRISMNSFTLENMQILPILFQAGYLTISEFDPVFGIYKLDYPNKEVKSAYTEGLLEVYSHSQEPLTGKALGMLSRALKAKDPVALQEAINQAFAHIPYDLWQRENEHFYHAILHLLFSLMGVYIQSEVHTKRGRADAVVVLDEGVFIFEFKLDRTAEEALAQIKTRGYAESHRTGNKPVYLIGLNFSSKTKAVEAVLWEALEKEKN